MISINLVEFFNKFSHSTFATITLTNARHFLFNFLNHICRTICKSAAFNTQHIIQVITGIGNFIWGILYLSQSLSATEQAYLPLLDSNLQFRFSGTIHKKYILERIWVTVSLSSIPQTIYSSIPMSF